MAKGLVADDRTISVSSIVSKINKWNGKAAAVNSYLERMCSSVNMYFLNNARVINHLKSSAKLCDLLFINTIKKMYSIWSPHTQSQPSRDKDLTLIRNKLTYDKIDCDLEKGNSNENFQYYLRSLCRKNLNRAILAKLNINSIRN